MVMRAMGKKKAEKGEQWRWSGGGETLDFKRSMNESLTEKLAFVKCWKGVTELVEKIREAECSGRRECAYVSEEDHSG